MQDDRADFLERRRKDSLALGKDNAVFENAVDALMKVDKYHYAYLWTWLGVPIIQLPADIIATQEVVWSKKPDIIIETGVARGGSVIFMASILSLLGRGKVIGVDIEIRPHNVETIRAHPMSHMIDLVVGPSTADHVLDQVSSLVPSGASVMVVLDSDHSYSHVLQELKAYSRFVTPGQYLVVADTLLGRLKAEQTPAERSKIWRLGDEPLTALREFLQEDATFEPDDEINGKLVFSSSPGGYIRRKVSL